MKKGILATELSLRLGVTDWQASSTSHLDSETGSGRVTVSVGDGHGHGDGPGQRVPGPGPLRLSHGGFNLKFWRRLYSGCHGCRGPPGPRGQAARRAKLRTQGALRRRRRRRGPAPAARCAVTLEKMSKSWVRVAGALGSMSLFLLITLAQFKARNPHASVLYNKWGTKDDSGKF